MRFVVSKPNRNRGASLGLQYPFIFGDVPGTVRKGVWHRHTGEVVYWADAENPVIADRQTRHKGYELNGQNWRVCEVDYDSVP